MGKKSYIYICMKRHQLWIFWIDQINSSCGQVFGREMKFMVLILSWSPIHGPPKMKCSEPLFRCFGDEFPDFWKYWNRLRSPKLGRLRIALLPGQWSCLLDDFWAESRIQFSGRTEGRKSSTAQCSMWNCSFCHPVCIIDMSVVAFESFYRFVTFIYWVATVSSDSTPTEAK